MRTRFPTTLFALCTSLFTGCELAPIDEEVSPEVGDTGSSSHTELEETLLPELYLVVMDWKEDCDAGVMSLTVMVSNYGDLAAPEGTTVQILSQPDLLVLAETTLDALEPGGVGQTVQLEFDLADLGTQGVLAVVDYGDTVAEYDTMPNELPWEHTCCDDDIEEPPVPKGEIWGTASAYMADWQSVYTTADDLPALGQRPGGLVWRLDLDTQQAHIVQMFDPELDDIWAVGGIALHPTDDIAYVTAFSYPEGPGDWNGPEYLDGWDTLIAIDTNTYQVIEQWDLDPDPFSFTGVAEDFVDGATGLYSPGGLQFVDGTLWAVEGMTVDHPNLVELDITTGEPIEHGAAFDYGSWGGGIQTDSSGDLWAVCAETPAPTPDIYMPVHWQWIPYELHQTHDCSEAVFELELDRVHGITIDADDTVYAGRSTRTHWYEEALGGVQAADLQLYTVDSDGAMTPFLDLTSVLSTAPMPIDGIGNISWRPTSD